MPINSFLYPGAKFTPPYQVGNSLRFDDGSSEYLERDFSTTQDSRRKFTFSAWVKRGALGGSINIWGSSEGSGEGYNSLKFESDDLQFLSGNTSNSGTQVNLVTDAKFRDTSAWLHVVLAVDSTDGTESNRIKIYVNGSQITSFSTSTYPSQNTDILTSTTPQQTIGMRDLRGTNAQFFDGYMCEVVFIDNQQLTPTSFGEFDSDSPNIWKPKSVSGLTFGTGGYYLEFKQSGTSQNSSGLGADTSGNDQHFAVSNLTAVDQSIDTCTNNACTLNPLYTYTNNMTYSEGNLKVVGGGNSWQGANSTFYINKGKWFFEVKFASATDVGNFYIGWTTAGDYNISEPYDNGIHYYNSDGGEIYANSSALTTADYGTFANGNIMGMALDYDNSLLTVYKNGSALVTDYDFSSATTTAKGGNLVTPTVAHYGSGTVEWNFSSPSYAISSGNTDGNGYGNFEYSVPSGYFALNTKNLAEFG